MPAPIALNDTARIVVHHSKPASLEQHLRLALGVAGR
jgi:hypothetical protein